MQRRILLVSILLVLGLPWLAQAQCPGQNGPLVPFAKEKLTVSSTAVGLTPAKYQQAAGVAAYASIQVRNAAVVVTDVGTPVLDEDDIFTIFATIPVCGIDSIRAFRAIRYSSTDATLIVRYYRTKQP